MPCLNRLVGQRQHSKHLSFLPFISFRNAPFSSVGWLVITDKDISTRIHMRSREHKRLCRVWRELSLCFCTGHRLQLQYRGWLKQDILRYRAHRRCWTQVPLSTVRTIHRTIPSYIPSSAGVHRGRPTRCLCHPFQIPRDAAHVHPMRRMLSVCMPARCQSKGRRPHRPKALTILLGLFTLPHLPLMSTGQDTPIPLALIIKLKR